MVTMEEAVAELMGPGGRFELAEEDVLGTPMTVFKRRPSSIAEYLKASAELGEIEYLVFGERRISYAEHARMVASTAAALRDRYGVGPGDRVAILAANCPEWIVAFWATVSLGAIAVGLNAWWAGDEIRYGVEHSDPTVLVIDTTRLERVGGRAAASKVFGSGVTIIEIERDFAALLTHDADAPLAETPIDEDDACIILYTSGTTGRPKGAVHSHRNVIGLVTIQLCNAALGARLGPPPVATPGVGAPGAAAGPADSSSPRAKTFISYPLFHVSGLHTGAIFQLVMGSTMVWNVGRFDPGRAMATIEAERCTAFSIVSTTGWRIVNHPDAGRYDLSSVIQIGGGAAPISGHLQERMRALFPNAAARMGIGYGLTETTALATLAGAADLLANPDTVGRPILTTTVEIRDDEGRLVPEGDEGEIWVRSPLVMKEYWRNPEATAQAIQPGRWLRTGDLGSMVGGMLSLSTRRKDLILRAGENVYPAEIENCLEAHPAVAEVAVVGVAHEELGQEVKAFIVAKPGADPTMLEPGALAAYVAERLAYYKVPAHWELRSDPLPRTATGKLVRDVLLGTAASTFVAD
jgi:long-chain acyl-CoA synthetase